MLVVSPSWDGPPAVPFLRCHFRHFWHVHFPSRYPFLVTLLPASFHTLLSSTDLPREARGPADRAHHAACRPRSSADQSAWPNSPCPSPPPPSHPPCRPSTKKHGTDLPRLTSLIFSQGTGSTLVHIPSHTILPPPPPPPAGEDIHFVRPGGCHLIIRHLAHSSGFISRRV